MTRPRQLTFQSTLERFAEGMEYYAFAVPEKITEALGTRAAVPVLATLNGSDPFTGSLFPMGAGRHWMRVRNKVCKAAGLGEGDRVRVKIEVRDRQTKVELPDDLKRALKQAGALAGFDDLPVGKRDFLLRKLDQAVKPETRAKRIHELVGEAHRRAGKAK